ncbi:MAG: transcription termination factor NusA [Christensenellaceae bacterium]|jgi:N utilization substance protein A
MNAEFITALDDIEREKGVEKEVLLDAIKTALISAYKRNFGATQEARVEIDEATGEIKVFAQKVVVEDLFDDTFEISLEDARKINIAYEPGDIIEEEVTPDSFGRIAAQTAKQVVVQRIREAERGVIYDEFIEKESELMSAVVLRQERGSYYMALGRAEGIMPLKETIPGERYETNMRVKVYVIEVKDSAKGPQIVVSRSHPGLIRRLFELEVPEISENLVEIKSIAREAGKRSKIAVYAEDENIDAVGACVGARGSRIGRVVEELSGERIDVIPWSEDSAEFIANALRPAQVLMTRVDEDTKEAEVIVPDNQLSLAIGKEGQNARLAAKLTGFKVDIKCQSDMSETMFGDFGDYDEDEYDDEEYYLDEEAYDDTEEYEESSEMLDEIEVLEDDEEMLEEMEELEILEEAEEALAELLEEDEEIAASEEA